MDHCIASDILSSVKARVRWGCTDKLVAEGQYCSDSEPLNAHDNIRGFIDQKMCHDLCISWKQDFCHYYTFTKESSGTCLLHSSCRKKAPLALSKYCTNCAGASRSYLLFGGTQPPFHYLLLTRSSNVLA